MVSACDISFRLSRPVLQHRETSRGDEKLTRLTAALALTAALLLSACPHRTRDNFVGDDRKMVDAANEIMLAINAYHVETSDWPDKIRDAAANLPPGTSWPVNPYNGAEIADTGKAAFDPATSVGNVYYEKFMREDQVVNYRLHVFGKDRELMIFGNSAFGAE